ncbi:hypothetical protein Patl1_33810 [Pistacia atlantica]|uniref:Uncharacterized protein n=1 Tax=Pistacia atlantica TaxID=434234 RepID=A0ACC0ZS41_9ROSI|nr:hypothetical protein Patl1_33810 [Pistacia atlantica]
MEGNDYFRYNMQYSNSSKSERVAFMQTVVANLTNGFKEIYAPGGRKFAIQNVGPLGCLPSTKANHPELNGTCFENFLTHPRFKHSIMKY